MSLAGIAYLIYAGIAGVHRRILRWVLRGQFAKCGKNVTFDPYGIYSFKNIYLGDDVQINEGAKLIAANTTITIGNKVLFGPDVTIRGGNHNVSVVGRYMFDVKDKRPEDDAPVVIEDDVWVGTRAIILKGVRIGRGAVVGAGSLVTRDVPPYAVVGGVPAKIMRWRWSVADTMRHEELLYKEPGMRLKRDVLLGARGELSRDSEASATVLRGDSGGLEEDLKG